MRAICRNLLAVASAFTLFSCAGGAAPSSPAVDLGNSIAGAPAAQVSFDPASIPTKVKMDAMDDITTLTGQLNQIIRRKEYESWKSYLTSEYIDLYSDTDVLAQMSDSSVLKRQGLVLHTLQDYFLYVVYPSRQSVRVDDIEFTSPSRVKAVTVAPSGDRQVIYYLEKIGETWKIGTGR